MYIKRPNTRGRWNLLKYVYIWCCHVLVAMYDTGYERIIA